MKPIGGEIAIKGSNLRSYFTDSGRSSLRLLLRSVDFSNQKFLIPDFFCGVIEDVLKKENIQYSFYKINEDFSINIKNLEIENFDVLYVINYFGNIHDLSKVDLKNKTLIEDNVFLYEFKNFHQAPKWFAFNSFRKISALTDGSLIKTNLEFEKCASKNNSALFSNLKKEACQIKYQFLTEDKFSETEYLNKFEAAEALIDEQKEIFDISPESLALLFQEDLNDQKVLKNRFLELQKLTNSKNNLPNYFSFFPLIVKDKVEFLKTMRSKNIFLPNFWPKTSQDNFLYHNLVVLPMFNNYTDEQFNYMINETRLILKND